MSNFYKELKRRKVLKNIGGYAAAGFIIMQVAEIVFPRLLLPPWTVTFVIILIILGFPITFFLSWTYDLKREAGIDDKAVRKDVESGRASRKMLLPLTGFLTIVGGTFWIWYSLGNVSSGSDLNLEMGIKKSIAVFSFENLTGQKEGDFFCSGISEGLRSALTRFSKLDVKSRHASLKKNEEDIALDYYVEGSLSKIGDDRNITVSLVNAKSGSNLWNNQYEFVENEILTFQDTIINNVLNKLNIDPSFTEFSSNKLGYKNTETFKLLGEGIYHFDNKNYSDALLSFDSVLELEPANIVANFHRANTYLELDNYKEAMNIYQTILSQSEDIEQIDWAWTLPKRKGIPQTYCSNIAISEEMNMAVILSKGKDGGLIIGFNTELNEIVWENPIPDKLVENPIIVNNMIFLTSSRVGQKQSGEPALYAYNILTGGSIFGKEFPRDNENQAKVVKIIEEYSSISNDNSTILLALKHFQLRGHGENYNEIALIETMTGSVLWKEKIGLSMGHDAESISINTGKAELLVWILDKDIITLNNKTGAKMWSKNFSSAKNLSLYFWNQKIVVKNRDENYVALWDPVAQKEVWKYYNKNELTWLKTGKFNESMGDDVILLNFTNGDLVAINFDSGFLNLFLERWNLNIGIAEQIWFQGNAYNRAFCLTKDDSLFTINLDNGKIINRFATDRHDYKVYYDNSQNGMVLNNDEYIIGVDPINGDQLWKIKHNGIDEVRLVKNTLLAVKTVIKDESLIINIYNRDNGNLIRNENIDISKSLNNWRFSSSLCKKVECIMCNNFSISSLKYYDGSLLFILHDGIIKVMPELSEKDMVQKKDVILKIAKTFMENDQLDSAIDEFNILLSQHDQMNQQAYWELATIYQKKNNVNDAVKTLLNYYDLILPTSPTGIQTIQKLKNLSGLKWKKDIYWDSFDNVDIGVDNEMIFLYLDNNIEAYRLNSGIMIWRTEIGNNDNHIASGGVMDEKHIFSIKVSQPGEDAFWSQTNTWGDMANYTKARRYSLIATEKRGGAIFFDIPLDIPGEGNVDWMGINNNKIFIQSIINNDMSIFAHDINNGDLLWKISRNISDYYRTYDLNPAFYNSNLYLPLDTKIEYINSDNGMLSGQYSSDYIEQIFSFNQNSIQNNTMIFFIEDIEIEYVVVDLEENAEINIGDINLDNPKLGSWINNIFVDVSSYGIVTAYNFGPAENMEIKTAWQENYNSPVSLLGSNKKNIYILDTDNNNIIVANSNAGGVIKSEALLWPVINLEMINNYIIVQSARKLYLISI